MKKVLMTAAALALTVGLGATAFAGHHAAGRGGCTAMNVERAACVYRDTDRSGLCGKQGGACVDYADADNDGVCDSCLDREAHPEHTVRHAEGCVAPGGHDGECRFAPVPGAERPGHSGGHGHGGRHH